jgi:hypothetical protein
VAGISILGLLSLANGCEARSSGEAAQTAIAGLQTTLPGLQTVLPGVQATAQAGATLVGSVLGDSQAIGGQIQALLAGVTIDIHIVPDGAANEAVTQVSVSGTDTRGSFAQMDPRTRQTAAGAALVLMSQYYPNATISLTVTDGSGGSLLNASKAPGQAPSIQ